MSALLGKKKGMTQVFNKEGHALGVTVLEAGPCAVILRRTKEKHGYDAVQLGFEEISEKRLSKPRLGHYKKRNSKPYRFLREFRVSEKETAKEGDILTASLFKEGDRVHVSGISKGRGFQGVMKRHGKAGGPASHGSRFHRTTGSIGQRTSPGEVFKNMKLPGHMGVDRVTTKNLEVVEVRENYLLLNGSVPGANNQLVEIRKA